MLEADSMWAVWDIARPLAWALLLLCFFVSRRSSQHREAELKAAAEADAAAAASMAVKAAMAAKQGAAAEQAAGGCCQDGAPAAGGCCQDEAEASGGCSQSASTDAAAGGSGCCQSSAGSAEPAAGGGCCQQSGGPNSAASSAARDVSRDAEAAQKRERIAAIAARISSAAPAAPRDLDAAQDDLTQLKAFYATTKGTSKVRAAPLALQQRWSRQPARAWLANTLLPIKRCARGATLGSCLPKSWCKTL